MDTPDVVGAATGVETAEASALVEQATNPPPSAEVREVIISQRGHVGTDAIARVMAVTDLQVLPRKDLQLIIDHGAASGLAELIEQLRRVGAEYFAWADRLAKIEPEKEEPELPPAQQAALVKAINEAAKAECWRLEQAEHPVDVAWIRHDGISPPGPLLWRLVDLFELAAGFELDVEAIIKNAAVGTKAERMAAARAAKKAKKDAADEAERRWAERQAEIDQREEAARLVRKAASDAILAEAVQRVEAAAPAEPLVGDEAATTKPTVIKVEPSKLEHKLELPADGSLPDFLKRAPDDFDQNAAAAVAGKRRLH